MSVIRDRDERIDWISTIPFILVHVAGLFGAGLLVGGWWYGLNMWPELITCLVLYYGRMFCITAGFHRYFSHHAFQLGRVMQFLIALGGTMAAQRGWGWWASWHVWHHGHSDQVDDVHSPLQKGFWFAQVGWIFARKYQQTRWEYLTEWLLFPELRWLDRHYLLPPTVLAVLCTVLGGLLAKDSFWLGALTTLNIGFFMSTVMLYHCTYFVNTFTHLVGRQVFPTKDGSRNSLWVAMVTMGEGLHNNHHFFSRCAAQGFLWWEKLFDATYLILLLLQFIGLAKGVGGPPAVILTKRMK